MFICTKAKTDHVILYINETKPKYAEDIEDQWGQSMTVLIKPIKPKCGFLHFSRVSGVPNSYSVRLFLVLTPLLRRGWAANKSQNMPSLSCWVWSLSPWQTTQVLRPRNSYEKLVRETRKKNSVRMSCILARVFFLCEKLVPSWSQLYSVQVSCPSFLSKFLERRTWVVCHGL